MSEPQDFSFPGAISAKFSGRPSVGFGLRKKAPASGQGLGGMLTLRQLGIFQNSILDILETMRTCPRET